MTRTRDLLVVAGEASGDSYAARVVREQGLPQLEAHVVASGGDLIPEGDFCGLYGITSSGAVLVRPDGHVGFRAPASVADPVAVLVEPAGKFRKPHRIEGFAQTCVV